jgi:superfamily II DNA or RNA helicase
MINIDFDPYLIKRAKTYIIQGAIPFIETFRNTAFGFVNTASDRGFFCQITIKKDQISNAICNCKDANKGLICEHMIALYLKSLAWPSEQLNQFSRWDVFPINLFFSEAPPKTMRMKLSDSSNPSFFPESDPENQRYWNFLFSTEDKLAKRDQKAYRFAVSRERTPGEIKMIQREIPSKRCLFEESMLYKIAKWAFFLHSHDALEWHLSLKENHQVCLYLLFQNTAFFQWEMSIAQFLNMSKNARPFWEKGFDVHFKPVGLPTKYSMTFTDAGDLLIQPGIGLNKFIPLANMERVDKMYYHPDTGYFYTQIGLSNFEWTHSSQPETHIKKQNIPQFVKNFQEDIEQIDHQFIDSALLGKIISNEIDRITLDLLDYKDPYFTAHIQCEINGQPVLMKQLCEESNRKKHRYWEFNQRFFDIRSMDGHILDALLQNTKGNHTEFTSQSLFQALMFFNDRIKVNTNDLTDTAYQAMSEMHIGSPPNLDGSNLNLRPYQHSGLKWLWFLHSFGLGGLLCDQMGLGKTHQGMALIQSIKNTKKNVHTMVVCPTSVLFHWADKLKHFCPGLSVSIFHGIQRKANLALKADVILTSYGTIRQSREEFKDTLFDLLILDEIQNIKNSNTKTHQCITKLKATSRIGLTGTPIENSLCDLKNTMEIVLPGYLGTEQLFIDNFEIPITKFKSQSARKQLKNLIHPFLLRRAKSEVLNELPEKIEDTRVFQLSSTERDLYNQIASEGKTRLEKQSSLSALHVFQIINSLKQFCDHPALYFKQGDYNSYPCQKWSIFTELLTETLQAGEKIVVFTQYLGMIDFFKTYLNHHSIGYACITGNVRNRQEEQNRFQTDPDCMVFIGTLGAAGVGIDLTAASVLIHYDRWWNPAREEQGTDRIHRIGQEKTVQVYKLLTLNTIEERIDHLITKKRDLLENIVEFDPEQTTKRLTIQELMEILA